MEKRVRRASIPREETSSSLSSISTNSSISLNPKQFQIPSKSNGKLKLVSLNSSIPKGWRILQYEQA